MNAPAFTMSIPPWRRSARFVFSAAGFMATRTSGASPEVWISFEPKLTW